MIKFFHNLQTPIETFLHMGKPKRSEKGGSITILFRITLNGNNVRSAPQFVKNAYEEIQDGADFVGLKKAIENVNVEIFNLPENKRATFRLPRLYLENLAVKEVKTAEGDTATVLCFQSEYPWDESVWAFMGQKYATTVFLKFDAAQADLLDVEEADTKGEDLTADDATEPAEG